MSGDMRLTHCAPAWLEAIVNAPFLLPVVRRFEVGGAQNGAHCFGPVWRSHGMNGSCHRSLPPPATILTRWLVKSRMRTKPLGRSARRKIGRWRVTLRRRRLAMGSSPTPPHRLWVRSTRTQRLCTVAWERGLSRCTAKGLSYASEPPLYAPQGLATGRRRVLFGTIGIALMGLAGLNMPELSKKIIEILVG